jgi:hypothetical protein
MKNEAIDRRGGSPENFVCSSPTVKISSFVYKTADGSWLADNKSLVIVMSKQLEGKEDKGIKPLLPRTTTIHRLATIMISHGMKSPWICAAQRCHYCLSKRNAQ